MIYSLGLDSELRNLKQYPDGEFHIVQVETVPPSDQLGEGSLFLIGSSVQNPVKTVQQIVQRDQLISIVVFALPERYNQVKQSLQYSPSVGKNVFCVNYNAEADYTATLANGITRTKQKRSFRRLTSAAHTKLSNLTSPGIKLHNLGNLLENAPIGALLLNHERLIIGANKTAREMFDGLDANQSRLNELFSVASVEMISSAIEKRSTESIVLNGVTGKYYECTSANVSYENGEHCIILINDITSKHERDRKVTAILESLPQIAWTADSSGSINYYNQGWYSLTGKNATEGMGDKWLDIVHPDDVPLARSRWFDAVRNGKAYHQSVRLKRFDGHYRWHMVNGTPITDSKKVIEMWVGTSSDVHEQVVANEELERKVKERTRLLEETNAELEQFAHISSHDLQEPLRKIQTFANIVKDDSYVNLSEHARNYLDKIITTCLRMTRLLKDLLSYSEINQVEPETVTNLNEIFDQIREDLGLAITQNNAVLHVDVLPEVIGRPVQLKQLFYNLITNSLKYRKPDVDPVINVRSQKLEKASQAKFRSLATQNDYCEIIVSDNGIGFDQKYADQIFTVFQRLHGRTRYEGTGIGLAIARKVVSNHRGEIYATSSVGVGATFHVILPALV